MASTAKVLGAARSVSQHIGAAVLGLVITLSAFGWLYLLRGPTSRLPGPRVPEALILDELSARSSASLWIFLFAWGATALRLPALPGLLGRKRLQPPLTRALGA